MQEIFCFSLEQVCYYCGSNGLVLQLADTIDALCNTNIDFDSRAAKKKPNLSRPPKCLSNDQKIFLSNRKDCKLLVKTASELCKEAVILVIHCLFYMFLLYGVNYIHYVIRL